MDFWNYLVDFYTHTHTHLTGFLNVDAAARQKAEQRLRTHSVDLIPFVKAQLMPLPRYRTTQGSWDNTNLLIISLVPLNTQEEIILTSISSHSASETTADTPQRECTLLHAYPSADVTLLSDSWLMTHPTVPSFICLCLSSLVWETEQRCAFHMLSYILHSYPIASCQEWYHTAYLLVRIMIQWRCNEIVNFQIPDLFIYLFLSKLKISSKQLNK